ncbi:hypothetical protein FOL47_003524 [Perkinsus chesapeaki]|uniref:Protein Abitram n=1 Tax=Perkinsus chesapeaki TaxID=330153 RepID=A0A7J6MZN6_PERCH|nr:hypothetical protein FOL47_003524 [Perkinsus chesapeaki]
MADVQAVASSSSEVPFDIAKGAGYWELQPPPLFRYFPLRQFKLAAGRLDGHHQYVHRHSNNIFLVGAAPTHVMFTENPGAKVKSVTYREGMTTTQVTGKRKRGAISVNPTTVLADVTLDNGKVYPLCACIKGDIIETNTRLCGGDAAKLMTPDYCETEGFVAILLLKLSRLNDGSQGLITEAEYLEKFPNARGPVRSRYRTTIPDALVSDEADDD